MEKMERTYSEEEAARLLKKAAKLQDATTTSIAGGVTQDELRRIAQEAGIDPKFLELAEIQPETRTKPLFLGLGEEFVYELPYSLSEQAERDFVDEVGACVKIFQSTVVGSTKRVQLGQAMLFGNLEITTRLGKTTVRLRQGPLRPYFAGLHLPLILGFVFAISLGVTGNMYGMIAGIASIFIGFGLFWFLAQSGRRTAESKWLEIVEILDRCASKDRNRGVTSLAPDENSELHLRA